MKPMHLSLTAVVIFAVLAACGGSPSSPSTVDPADADVTITADDLVFDQSTITVPAGEAFTIALVNLEAAQHNVAIYTDSSASEELYVGDYVGEGTIVYDISALEPGEYFFRCDLHPEMTGTLIVEG